LCTFAKVIAQLAQGFSKLRNKIGYGRLVTTWKCKTMRRRF